LRRGERAEHGRPDRPANLLGGVDHRGRDAGFSGYQPGRALARVVEGRDSRYGSVPQNFAELE
jgi:hypothetical protein